MHDEFLRGLAPQAASPEQPLAGLTLLLVEDSRHASDALRLFALHAGARLRRADCLASARRHLATYRPDVAIIDLGLPDGSGRDLAAEIAGRPAPRPAVIITSGDPAAAEAASGLADGILPKPAGTLAQFCSVILAVCPGDAVHPAAATTVVAGPDPLALRDDLVRARNLLGTPGAAESLPYVAGFVGGLARSSDDPALAEAADRLARAAGPGLRLRPHVNRLAGLIDDRLGQSPGL
ncbi:MAG: hypothetical protein RLZZ528_442 [Pseudomonadota bacterium]